MTIVFDMQFGPHPNTGKTKKAPHPCEALILVVVPPGLEPGTT